MSASASEELAFSNGAALSKAWRPQARVQMPVPFLGQNQQPALRFQAPFSQLDDWRVFWDLDAKADLSQIDQLVVTVRAADPTTVSQGVLYVRSGAGWYRLPPFSVGRDWAVKVLSKSQAVAEGAPAGWSLVDGLRLSITPTAGRDASVELTDLRTRRGWPLRHLGAVGGHDDLKHAAQAFLAAARGAAQEADVAARLTQAEQQEQLAAKAQDDDSRQSVILAGRARMAEAYALLQPPKDGEFRGLWLHFGDGPRGLGTDRVQRWTEALPAMKALGYNAVIPNVLWSGVAFYPSRLVPNHPGVAREGDYLQEILDASKPLGLNVHAWKVMWRFAANQLSPVDVSEPFRRAGRLQVDALGRDMPWLCPCDERNRQYELAAIIELATRYAVDGIHLDYLRWNGEQGSFSVMCRKRFEKWSGVPATDWPGEVLKPGPRQRQWQEFKREVITSFLRETRSALRSLKPGLQLSAAVFPDPMAARQTVFQDWPLWVKDGLVDWISTMTYDEDPKAFKSAVQRQQALMVNPAVKLYPGLQFTHDGGRTLALESAVDQIKAVRALELPGFVVFEWRDQLQDSLAPYLRAGLLRTGPYAAVAAFERQLPAYAKVAKPVPGKALGLLPSNDGTYLLDDFEDGDLNNLARGRWGLDMDSHRLGTLVQPLPLRTQVGGADGSRYSLGFRGHIGKNQAPWPYAKLYSRLDPNDDSVDLSPFKGLRFYAKGDGNLYEVTLRQRVVKDYGHYRATFKAERSWQQVELKWSDFKQPGWAKPMPRNLVDIDQVEFSPVGRDNEDFDLSIDTVKFWH